MIWQKSRRKLKFIELYDSLERMDSSAKDSIPLTLPKNLPKESTQESQEWMRKRTRRKGRIRFFDATWVVHSWSHFATNGGGPDVLYSCQGGGWRQGWSV
jgi:hypothetical protein